MNRQGSGKENIMKIKINNKSVTCDAFAFDGCHKFYLIQSEEDRIEAVRIGYKVLPLNELAKTFYQSCPLRFVENWALTEGYVPQCEETVTFEIGNVRSYMDFVNDTYSEEMA